MFDTEKEWLLFTPINGDWWWINEQRLSKTDDGGLLIQLDCESFEADKLPTTDRVGGLIQLQVDGKWIQTETVSTLQMVAKGTSANKVESPLLPKI